MMKELRCPRPNRDQEAEHNAGHTFGSVGEYIRSKRREAGYETLSNLARATGLSTASLFHLEAGHHTPTPTTLDRLAVALDDDRDRLYILAGYWPPSLKRNPLVLDYLRRERPEYFANHDATLPNSWPRRYRPDEGVVPGTALRELRHNLELTQSDFAQRCGFSSNYISSLETGAARLTERTYRTILERVTTGNGLPQSDPASRSAPAKYPRRQETSTDREN